jgi:hypothetical protein
MFYGIGVNGKQLPVVRETIQKQGLFCSLHTNRGSHYWHTQQAVGKVDKVILTRFGRALKHLGITMIEAYSTDARGGSERMFRTHQDRLPRELARQGIRTMEAANQYLQRKYLPRRTGVFCVAARETGTAYVPCSGTEPKDILCEHYEATAGYDNCVHFDKRILQIPSDQYRFH